MSISTRELVPAGALAGAVVFAALFLLSYFSPVTIEKWARGTIQREIETRVAARSKVAQLVLAELPGRIASVSGEMLDPACPCRERARDLLREQLSNGTGLPSGGNERLVALIQSTYAEVSGSLLREWRVFCAANALVFAWLAVVAAVRRRTGSQPVLPAIVLLGAALVVACLSLFAPNWLHTALLGRYAGLWYFPYLALASALLARRRR